MPETKNRKPKSVTTPAGRTIWLPIALLRWAVWSALLIALIAAIVLTSFQFSLDRSCKGGAFDSGFSSAFDVRRCGISIEHLPTGRKITIPLPMNWF